MIADHQRGDHRARRDPERLEHVGADQQDRDDRREPGPHHVGQPRGSPFRAIVVNEALKLPRGKLAAQVAHASVAALLEATADARRRWLEEGMPKVVLRCESEEELLALGFRVVPVTMINGHAVPGWDEPAIRAALAAPQS